MIPSDAITNFLNIRVESKEAVPDLADPTEMPTTKADNCWICQTKFSMMKGIYRHHCRFCGNSVCADHSARKRRRGDEAQRICDKCFQDFAREEVKKEIQSKVSSLHRDLDAVRGDNERLLDVNSRKRTEFKQLENDLSVLEREHRQAVLDLKREIEEEIQRGERARDSVETLRKTLEDTNRSEQELDSKGKEAEREAKRVQNEIEAVKQEKKDLTDQIEYLNDQMRGGVPFSAVKELLCANCLGKLREQLKDESDSSYVSQTLGRQSTGDP
jgi:DNA repair exonuclease SbcCD ATPase subunit